MSILDKLEADFIKKREDERVRTKLRSDLKGLYSLMRTNREFSDEDKISVFNEIYKIVRDEKF